MTRSPRVVVWAVVAVLSSCGTPSGTDAGTGGGGGTATGGGGGSGGGSGGGVSAGDGGPGLDARVANTTCIAPNPNSLPTGYATKRAFANLTFNAPLGMFQAPGDTTKVYVQERDGLIRKFPNQAGAMTAQVTTFVDFSTKVDAQGEGGFLGMAFHPNWPTTPEVFVSYTETSNPLRSVIARLKSSDNGNTLDPASEERLLTLEQPYSNHKGGGIAFGPDGFLYIGFGDGGSGGDPLNSGQRLNTNLGKFLRIDVNVPFAQKYAIPSDNPYAGDNTPCNRMSAQTSAATNVKCAEIWALGLRNPWRWSFDTVTGDLWVGDVGQDSYEEVDLITRGGNYGWKIREGAHCYGGAGCTTTDLIDPVVEYDRSLGNSMTGGFVYRGTAAPGLLGKFIFGDYGSGRIMVAEPDGAGGFQTLPIVDTSFGLAAFGQLADGEVYALDVFTGRIHQIIAVTSDGGASTFPLLLSQTGCFKANAPREPVAALVPYDLNAALWSDGATKERFFAIPDGTTIAVEANGDFTFPNGTVLAKTFLLAGKPVETRLFMRHNDGNWAGYSYEWNDAATEATLLSSGKQKTVGNQTWTYPSASECLQCHTVVAGRSLGPEIGQLNRDIVYPSTGRTANQLTTLSKLGYLSAPLSGPVSTLAALAQPFGNGPLENRARAYLHANCSGCHREHNVPGPEDWRYSLPFKDTGTCDATPTLGNLGVMNAKLIAPGDPSKSVVSLRMHATMFNRMPPLGRLMVDPAGTALIDDWIRSISSCPQ